MKPYLSVFCLLLALPHPAAAEWVQASASYAFSPDMTEAEACQQAENRARAEAVRQVIGETLSAEDVTRCTEDGEEAQCARNSTTWTMIGGEIKATRNRTQHTTAENVGAQVFRRCVFSFEADVHVAQGQPDPNFTIGVTLNNAVFRDGEALTVTLKPSQPMAVQIFQWLPYERGDAQVSRIFPNAFDGMKRIGGPVSIPTEAGAKRYDLKVTFPGNQLSGRRMADEYLMVVATKQPVTFRDSYGLDDFNRAIAEIPLDQRRIVRRAYNVVRGAE